MTDEASHLPAREVKPGPLSWDPRQRKLKALRPQFWRGPVSAVWGTGAARGELGVSGRWRQGTCSPEVKRWSLNCSQNGAENSGGQERAPRRASGEGTGDATGRTESSFLSEALSQSHTNDKLSALIFIRTILFEKLCISGSLLLLVFLFPLQLSVER